MLRHILLALAAVFAILAVVILVVPFLISSERLQADLSSQFETATGYRISFAGDVGLRGIPALAFNADDVTLTARDSGATVQTVAADGVRLQLNLFSLFSGRARFEEITFLRPTVRLGEGGASATQTPTDDGGAPVDLAAQLGYLERLQIDRFRIENGRLVMPGRDGAETTLAIESLEIALPSIASRSDLTARIGLNDQVFDVTAAIDTPRRLLTEEPTALSARVLAPAYFEGELALIATAGLSATGIALTDLSVTGDAMSLSGSLSADWSEAIPRVTAELGGEHLALADIKTGGGDTAPTAAPEAPLDLSGLAAADINLGLSINRVTAGDITIAPVVGRVRTAGGILDLGLDLVGIGGGTVIGNLSIDPAGGDNQTSGRVEIDGIDMAAIQDFVALPYPVTGKFGATLNYATIGRTVDEMRQRANAAGQVFLSQATIANLGLSPAIGDPAADRVDAVGIIAEFDSLTAPVALRGGATWRGERFNLDATVDASALIAGNPGSASLTVASSRLNAGYNGTLTTSGQLNGAVTVETPSLRGLLAWLNQPLGEGTGLERFAFSGRLAVSPDAIAFSDARLALDATEGTGEGRLALGAVPRVEATLALQTLDLNPYLGASDSGEAGGGGSSGWSEAPIDLSGLRAANAALSLSVQSLVYEDLKTGPVAMTAALDGGRLSADLTNLALYGGEGLGRVVLDGSAQVPSLALQFDLFNLDARPFLNDLADFNRIEGRAAMAIDVSTSGASELALASGMNGQASVRFTDGAIRGINLAQMMRSLTTGALLGWQENPAASTDFSELSASFQIANGVAQNNDLRLVGPLVRVTGAGTISLPAQQLDYRVDPKLVASLQGQGTTADAAGFGVPIRVTGPWARPNIYPDIAGILENPEAAYKQLQSLGGGIFQALGAGDGLNVGNVVEGATGVDVGDIIQDGQINQDAAVGAAVEGVGRLLGVETAPQQPAQSAQPEAGAPVPLDPNAQATGQTDAGAPVSLDPNAQQAAPQQQQQQAPAIDLDDTARSVLRGIFGNN